MARFEERNQDLSIRLSEEYKLYLQNLCRLASRWVPRIRAQFADKAYEMYQNETVRKLVMAYGVEYEKLEKDRLFDFTMAAEHGYDEDKVDVQLGDSCLSKASSYADAIWLLFGIE